MFNLIRRWFLQFIILLSCVALGVAFVAQYAFGKVPCELCLIQRLPYFGVVIFGFVALFIGEWSRRGVAYLFCLVFCLGSLIAFYHVGVESQWWRAVTACADAKPLPENLQELKNSLSIAMPKPCDEVSWTILGMSAAVYNTVFSLVLALLCWSWADVFKRR